MYSIVDLCKWLLLINYFLFEKKEVEKTIILETNQTKYIKIFQNIYFIIRKTETAY